VQIVVSNACPKERHSSRQVPPWLIFDVGQKYVKPGTEFHFPAVVLLHHDGGTSRVKILGVGRPSSDPDYPYWDIPTKCVPEALRRIGTKVVVHYVTQHPEAHDTADQIRDARDSYLVEPLSEADELRIDSESPAYWARQVDWPRKNA
jgi:hypothetical protein